MAQDLKIANALYNDVPSVSIPTQGGGSASYIDTSDANATAGDILQGKTAYVNGAKITGTSQEKAAGVPVGFEYFQMNPNVPAGSLPLLGGEYSRTTYADLWAWVQTQNGYLLEESAWQAKAAANGGNVPFYSKGDGSTTFRVPALKCWVRGANSINEVGGYLAAGWGTNNGAIKVATHTGDSSGCVARGSSSPPMLGVTIPASIVGMWLVKAYGTIVDTGSIDEQQYIDEKISQVESSYLPVAEGAGFHNSIFRGKNLGSSVTGEQYNNIENGTFNDMFIGDYWVINGVNWRIAAFDYWLHCGDTECTTHHVVIVPDTNLATCQMNNSNVTTGAYIGSNYYTGANSNTGKAKANTAINNAFGSSHILTHREYLQNAVTNDYESGGTWYDSKFELMTERMVYGCDIFHNTMNGTNIPNWFSIDKSQMPLFALEPSRITNRADWWLRDVVSNSYFALIGYAGLANSAYASVLLGVRPAFAIKK